MSAPPVRYSVVLPTRDAGPGFREVLEGLVACRGIDEAEILVIDSGSEDGTAELAATFPRVRVLRIPSREFGHGRTRNLGASEARGEILVFLVQDATPADAGFLESLVEPLARDPRIAAAYGRQLPRPEATPVEAEFLRQTYPPEPAVRRLDPPAGRVAIGSVFFSNVCSAVRRAVWSRFPFDETLIMSEDQKWAREVLEAGWRIAYQPAAAVLHSHHYPLAKVFRRNFDSGCSLAGVTQDSRRAMLGYELGFVRAAAGALRRRGEARWLPYLVAHELARTLGFAAGRQASWLPRALRRRLSLHRAFWDRP